ncbi:MAG: pyruvate, phosphate dikinase [Caldilineaceae bacterium]|nr:pyruvate, phosphate dikinase [Caldilineaceae bacterium]
MNPYDRNYKWVYLLTEGNGDMRTLFGGKGAGVSEMIQAGLPVPPGFAITTEACNAYYANERQFPEGMWTQATIALHSLEEQTGKRFGAPENPLLISVRSGAAISMPGMMDTVLNLGLNDETTEGLAALTGERRFALDAYRRFIAMFGHIVMGVDSAKFDRVLERTKIHTQGGRDTDLSETQLEEVIEAYKRIIFAEQHGQPFPQDPHSQLRMAISAVFDSWMGRRAVDYRRVYRIADELGTAVTVQAMVFGNLNWESGTGVAFTRNPSTGERSLYGEYLLNAQGEDVVAGTRTPKYIKELAQELPQVAAQLDEITQSLERHYRDMQDIEFTIEWGKLWLLQTRSGKRTGAAAVRIAVDMVTEGLIDQSTAILRIEPDQLEQLLHPTVAPDAEAIVLTTGLPASPGAAAGIVILDPDEAEKLAQDSDAEPFVLVRHETSPEDFHGMVGAQAVLTVRGGMTSHAAVVARGMGKPCVAGAGSIEIDPHQECLRIGEHVVRKGAWITVDGSTGRVFLGKVPTSEPEFHDDLLQLLAWADERRTLRVRANADTAADAKMARSFGAEGIGLSRTEHMFFDEERLEPMRQMILAENWAERVQALEKILPLQQQDFMAIFRVMDRLPVTIRLLDPPLHEFLPSREDLVTEITELRFTLLQHSQSMSHVAQLISQISERETLLRQVDRLREVNPMLGHRGCRLGLVYPEVTEMQVRAIFEAACTVKSEGIEVLLEIMVPLVATSVELLNQSEIIHRVAREVTGAHGLTLDYKVGTMIELPRAALVADRIAQHADFFSFGTNDLTQTTLGMSRDDSAHFLPSYIVHKVLPDDPFQVIDEEGVGQLIQLGVERGRATNPQLKTGICGEHGGNPRSIAFFNRVGVDYVSCSPFRVPIARLAAAQAAIRSSQA